MSAARPLMPPPMIAMLRVSSCVVEGMIDERWNFRERKKKGTYYIWVQKQVQDINK
jgi:hypothetical protein